MIITLPFYTVYIKLIDRGYKGIITNATITPNFI